MAAWGTNLQKSARMSTPIPPHAEHRRHRASQGQWPALAQGRSPAPGQRSPTGGILLVSGSLHDGPVMNGPPVHCSYCSNYGARGTRCIPRQPNGSSRLLFVRAETRCSRGGARRESPRCGKSPSPPPGEPVSYFGYPTGKTRINFPILLAAAGPAKAYCERLLLCGLSQAGWMLPTEGMLRTAAGRER